MNRLVTAFVVIAGLPGIVPAVSAQPVQGDVVSVGFPAANQAGRVVRAGQWFPIITQLTVQGSGVFQGQLRVECVDLDGDRVEFIESQVAVTPDSVKRVWSYGLANSFGELPKYLDILTDNGIRVNRLQMPPVEIISNDDYLVVDISERQLIGLNSLTTPGWSPLAPSLGARPFYRDIVVSRLAAADLPDRWFGLEAVNVIIWDSPKPTQLSPAQIDSLIRWVKNGGELVIGIGASWDALQRSPLAEILPVAGDGAPVEMVESDVFFNPSNRLVEERVENRQFRGPVAFSTAKLADGAIRLLGDASPRGTIELFAMKNIGAGRVVTSAAALRDLTDVPVNAAVFYGYLFGIHAHTKEFRDKAIEFASSLQGEMGMPDSLYMTISQGVSFARESALRGFIIFAFVVAYLGIATAGSWWWLSRRKLTYLSWSIFAAFAVIGSGLSLAAVTGLRGISYGTQSVEIVDLVAGQPEAGAYCLFGYRSPTRTFPSLSLPGEESFLRGLSRGGRAPSTYVTPLRYQGIPSKALLDETPLRATLKQFEGYWKGKLEGTIRGQLVADRGTGQITPESWIANELPVGFAGGYLLYIDPRIEAAGVPSRVTALTRSYNPRISRVVPPAMNVLAVQIGAIAAGQRTAGIGERQYTALPNAQREWDDTVGKREDKRWHTRPDLPTLWGEQLAWAGRSTWEMLGFGSTSFLKSLLMASTRDVFLNNANRDDLDSVASTVTTEGLPDLDITSWLTRGEAVLLLWANDPGPARLYYDGEPLRTASGFSFYRVRIPIDYTGSPPRPAPETTP